MAFLKPCCQRCSCFSNHAIYSVWINKFVSLWCFGRRIRVTQENWAFFFSRKSQFTTRLHRVKSSKNHQKLYSIREDWNKLKTWKKSWALVCMPARFLFLHVPLRISPRMSWPPSNSTLQFRLWGGFGEALRRLGEAWEASGASKLILGLPLGGFGRLWETLGEPLGKLWEALGSFGRRWGSLWEVFGRLWGSFGSLSEPFFSSRLLFLPYI